MYSCVKTCVLHGIEGHIVDVETDLARGLPVFNIVGLPDASIKESKERVRAAIKNSDFEFPLSRITINLAPANLKKEGSQIDLAIAVGILKASMVIVREIDDSTVIIGELSLDGKINGISGALPMVISMRQEGYKRCIIPESNKYECSPVQDIEIIPVTTLEELVLYLNGELTLEPCTEFKYSISENLSAEMDFSEIKGQRNLKRCLEIAASAMHAVLMIGPPGSGKTMSASRLPSILPPLNFEESIECTKIFSVSGKLNGKGLIQTRPFRSPHHTASAVALVGGGKIPKPGEVSLAHNGVLFLDELPEFSKNVLEVLRQPMEDGVVHISRANANLSFPAKFMLVAAMNPCPCGYFGDPTHECSCSVHQISSYLGKISGPLLDRIDLHIEVNAVKIDDINAQEPEESSKTVRSRVEAAVRIQEERFDGLNIMRNSQMNGKHIKSFCTLNKDAQKIMELAFQKYNFSARAYHKILKVSRTIADLAGSKNIEEEHLLEAIRYRSVHSKYWNG